VIGAWLFKMAKKVELPNSRTFGEKELHEMSSTLGVDSLVPHSPSPKVSPLCVIFYGIIVSTHFDRGRYQRAPSPIVVFKLGLRIFFERCVMQFHLYISFVA
jgi:hypothetical protein